MSQAWRNCLLQYMFSHVKMRLFNFSWDIIFITAHEIYSQNPRVFRLKDQF